MKRYLLWFSLPLLLAGCITPWTRIDQPTPLAGAGGKFTVQAPPGWVHFSLERNHVVLTRDGLPVQYIDVALTPHADAFKQIKRASNPSMLPAELAELAVAELRADSGLVNLTVKESVPASVAGQPGFRLLLQYRNPRGALLNRLIYGTATKQGLLTFSYSALDRHYFPRDLGVFEQVMASYRLAPAS